MVIRIAIMGVLAIALMLVVRDGRLVRDLEVVSRCDTITNPTGQIGTWKACYKGKIDGRRDLKDQGCVVIRATPSVDVWQCLPEKL